MKIEILDAIKEKGKSRQRLNKNKIDNMTAELLKYYSDDENVDRLKNGMCKYCFYVASDRVGLSVMTTKACGCCGKEMVFGSSCTDIYCLDCAIEIKHCKVCGQELD